MASRERAKLEAEVLPVLLGAFSELVDEKPQEPLKFIAEYLMRNNPRKVAYKTQF